jgi:hypothetical protein
MTTSPVPSEPFEVNADEISDGTFAYFCSRNRMAVWTLVNKEFDRAGVTQAEVAKRMKKGTDRISRLLGAPGNWTLDTASELLLAISGAQISYGLHYPCAESPTIFHDPKTLIAVEADARLNYFEVSGTSGHRITYNLTQNDDGLKTAPLKLAVTG